MAEAFLNSMAGDSFEAESAGFEVRELNPLAVAVMKEVGIDISGNKTKEIFDLYRHGRSFSHEIKVCDRVINQSLAPLDLAKVEEAINGVTGVHYVHDLHIWTISSGLIASSSHIVVAEQSVTDSQQILQNVAHMLEHEFKIGHSTIQVEVDDCGGHEHKANNQHNHSH